MANWIYKPRRDEFVTDPKQAMFLTGRRIRVCRGCGKQYFVANPAEPACVHCGGKGRRKFNFMSIFAGRRFGKSCLGAMSCYDEASVPNTLGWACAPTIKALNRYTIPAFQELIEPEAVQSYNSQFGDLWLKNGSLIHFQTLDNPDDGRGPGLDWCWIDEVCLLTELHWDTLSPALAGDTISLFTTTPQGYDWARRRLWLPAQNGRPGFWAMKAHSSESPNPRLTPEYLAQQRLEMGDEMYRQEYEADFVNFEGAIYSGTIISNQTLRSDEEVRKHIPEWPQINPWRPVYIGIDTGADHPFGAAKVVATDHALVVVEDYLERFGAFIEHAAALKLLAGPNPTTYCINKNELQPSIELERHGINVTRAENEQLAGTERVKSWLHQKRLFFVESRVPRTIEQMRSLRHAKPRQDEQSRGTLTVYKKNDELADVLRYVLMSMPDLPPDPELVSSRDITNFSENRQQDIRRGRQWEQRCKQQHDSPTGPATVSYDLEDFYDG